MPFFSRLASMKEDPELSKAVIFLAPMMNINAVGVVSAGYFCSTLTSILLLFLLYVMGTSLLIALPLTLIFSVIVHYAITNHPVSIMNSYQLRLSEESDLVYEQFILVFQSGGTIFDAIEMVAQSGHPYLSKAFQQMLGEISIGTPPEVCLMEFAKNQPSDDLRRYITAIISSVEEKTELLDMLSGESYEADMTLRQKNLELESRLLIVAALSTYLPIMITLAVSLSGHATNPLVLLLIPVFIGFNALFTSRFAKQFSAYFDRPREDSILPPSQREIIAEYDEFLNFLLLLGERLRSGDTLEVSIGAIRDDVGCRVQCLLDPAIETVYLESGSIGEAMKVAASRALGQRVAHMFGVIGVMCEMSAVDAGVRLTRIAARLIKRSAVAKERDTIIAAQKLKVYILTLVSAAVLGLLSSLAPFLFIGSILTDGPTTGFGALSVLEIMPLLATLAITTMTTGYQNVRMVGGSRPLLFAIVCVLTFWLCFMMSASILNVGFV